ncbi:hypothetical protein C1645_788951 [Glomus cerebriforme]|uniref:Uncharacterized protein n=1 Tax=Glomus cerebriforme TaxID=658196 RepID=A0A397SCX8_9GLOM|nr:hypothetical protein C1645_788951 [Glomus cerebriforme]
MEPETFINSLLDHIESKAVISTEYNYLYLHTWKVAPEIAARLPSTYKSYQDVLFTYICSNNIVPECDLTINGNFLAHVLAKRLHDSANPKIYTPILKFFNTFEPQEKFFPFRPSLELLIKQVLDDSRVPGQTIHWLLSFIRDQADWLYSNSDSTEIQRNEDLRNFLSEKFSKMSKTLLYEDLELLRIVQGISKINNIKMKSDFTQEEILFSQKLHACQDILDTVTLYPSEHRVHRSDLNKIITRQDFTKLRPLHMMFKIYKAEFPCQTDLLLNQLRLERLITIQEIESLKLKPFLKILMYNNIVNECLEYLELSELELAQCLRNNQDILSEYEYFDVFNLLAEHKIELNSIYEAFSTLKNNEIILILLDIAEFVINVPIKFMMRVILSLSLLHRLCSEKYKNILNDSNVPNKDINFKEINRIILDIWLTSFSQQRNSRFPSTYQVKSSEILKNLQIFTTLFLFTFYASSSFTWFQYYTFPSDAKEENTMETYRPTLTLFVENLTKTFKVLLDNELCEERKSIETLIHVIFDKLGFEVPLETIIKESKYLEVIRKDPWTNLLEERLHNVIQEESM